MANEAKMRTVRFWIAPDNDETFRAELRAFLLAVAPLEGQEVTDPDGGEFRGLLVELVDPEQFAAFQKLEESETIDKILEDSWRGQHG